MTQPQPDTAWYAALTLTERIASLRAHPDVPGPVDAALAEKRLKRWREKPPLSDEARFAQRLKSAGLTRDELLRLLGEPLEALRARVPTPPQWMVDLEAALARPGPETGLPYSEELRRDPNAALLVAAEPFMAQGFERFQAGLDALVRAHPEAPFEPATASALLFAPLPAQLLALLGRTMALEINVARVSGLLTGDTPAERFQSFTTRLGQREVLRELYREYPLLARQLVTRVGLWVDTSLEFLGRLCADWEDIRRVLSPGREPGRLAAVRTGMGDVHRGGHAVMSAAFSSGLKLVYKPRPVATDVHFQELLAWVNARGLPTPFQLTPLVARPHHGWFTFVEAAGCESEEEVRRFYRRMGGLLALLYVLEGTDFHFENVIAAGEQPILVDLESLLHPTLRVSERMEELRRELEVYDSVLRIGLLPGRAWEDQRTAGVDISGMGNPEGKTGNRPAPAVVGAGTDEFTFTRRPGRFRRGQNRPTLRGEDVDPLQYEGAVAEGFNELYALLERYRGELLAEGGLLASLTGAEVRVLLRPTFVYKAMLLEGAHPDLLRNALDRDRYFEKLWLNVDRFPFVTQISHAERASLDRGDVPLFTTFPASRSVWGDPGEEIPDVFDESGLERVRRRVAGLGEEDRSRQLWLIRASFATLALDADPLRLAGYTPAAPRVPATRERLLTAARAAGDRLEALSLRDGEERTWFGLTLGWNRQWRLMPLGLDLYGGLPGVALFLAYLGEVTGEARYRALAESAVRTMRRKHGDARSQLPAVGGYLGWGGLLYAYAHLGRLWGRPDLMDMAASCVAVLEARIDEDDSLDVLGGAAGAILALSALQRCAPSERTVAAARRCGEHLLKTARRQERGLGWHTRLQPEAALTGFSHGTAGIACALLEVEALTGEARFREAAREALEYERSLFAHEPGNWPDLRGAPGSRTFKTAWCHGSTGIGLARLASVRHLDDATVRGDIAAALKDTRAQGLGRDFSLCHGDAGSLELLLAAREALGDAALPPVMTEWTGTLLEGIERHGWLSGVPFGVETPGLLVGMAGTGYTLLRLAEPKRVPSVLVLEPPR